MFTVYGIPTCQTVKKARRWLADRGVEAEFVNLRSAPPSREHVSKWIDAFGSKPMRNTSGGSYRALPPEKKTWDDATWLDHFAGDPMLLKRPIIEKDGEPVLVGFRGSDEDLEGRLL